VTEVARVDSKRLSDALDRQVAIREILLDILNSLKDKGVSRMLRRFFRRIDQGRRTGSHRRFCARTVEAKINVRCLKVPNQNIEYSDETLEPLLRFVRRTYELERSVASAVADDWKYRAVQPVLASVAVRSEAPFQFRKVELPGFTTIIAASILGASWMSGVGRRIFITFECRRGYVGDYNDYAACAGEGINDVFAESVSQRRRIQFLCL